MKMLNNKGDKTMTLVKFEPLKDLELFRGNIRRFFDDFPIPSFDFNSDFHPRMDISEDEKHVYIEAEIPGVEKKDLKISVQDNVLTISGEKKKEEEKKGKNYYRSERVYGSFTRSMTLPEDVNVEKVDAKFEEGILKITLEKLEQKPVKEKLIDIK